MAQLKDLIVNGPSRFIGDVYATTFTGDLNGNANTATSATTAVALTGKTLVTASAVTTSNWPTYGNNHIPTMSFMAHWNGAYSGTSSNLTYCAQGAIIGSNNIGNQSVKYATTSGSCSGNAATATKATQDGNGNVIANTYLPLSGGTMTGALGKSSNYLIKPVADYRTRDVAHTGCIAITLPATIGDTMVSMWIDVYNYVKNSSFSVHCGGYTYSNSTWVNSPFALVFGANHRVRFGHDGTNFVIYIGETDSTWRYPQVTVRDVIIGYTPTYANWYKDWTISFVTSVSNVTADITRYSITSSNISSQSVNYASSAGTVAWGNVTGKPTTISGYSITDALKIDGSNGTAAGVSSLINKLSIGSSDPTDADYYVCQYVGGGTTTTTYHRRPMSSMWNWIKAKTDTLYPTKSGSGATGTWGISISGNAATATKVGTSTVGSTTMPVYINSGTPTAISSLPESYLSWGGLPIEGNISPIDAACCSDFNHNKLAFLPADCITVEYTTNGGSTWIDYGASDVQKISLVTSETAFLIGKGAASAIDGTMTNSNCSNYQVRVTVSSINSSGTHKIYTSSKKLLINISSNGASGCKIKMETQTIGDYNNNVDTWTTIKTYNVSGWSAWNSIPLYFSGGSFGGFEDQIYKVAKLRLTLSITGVVSSSSQASILGLRLIGTSSWINPSIMSRTGHLYDFDANQNATFPGAITSTMFKKSGGTSSQFLKADGSVDSNTYSKSSHTHSSVLDVSSNSTITFAYSKAGLSYGDYTWLAGWYGSELRAISKSQFAQASHTHTKSQITDFPSSLPANGGNADTSNRAKFLETFQQNSTTTTYGSQYPIWAQWSDSANVKLKCTNYTVWTDKATYATTAGSAPASDVKAWAKADTKPSYNGSEVKLSNYSKASSYSEIAASDTVNQAIGKLEGAIRGLENLLASI